VIDMKSTTAQGQPPLEDADRHAEGQEPEDRCARWSPRRSSPPCGSLRAVEESNDQGSWSNWQVEKVGLLTDRNLMLEAKTFRDSIAAGEVKAAPEADESASGASRQVDSDIPF
jgi:hypothetical protein